MIQVPKHKLVLEVPGGAKRVLLHTCCAPCSSAIIECMLQQGITPVIYYSNANIFPLEEYNHRKDECTRYAESLGLEIVDDDWAHDEWRCRVARGRENEPERGARCLECFKFRLLRAAEYAVEHGFTVLTTTLASSRWKDLEQVNVAGQWACNTVNQAMASGSDSCGSLSPDNRLTAFGPSHRERWAPPSYVAEGGTGCWGTAPVNCQNYGGNTAGDTGGWSEVKSASADRPGRDFCDSKSWKGEKAAGDSRGQSPLTWWSQNWRKGGLQDRRNQIIKEMDFYNQLYCGCEYSMRNNTEEKDKQ